MMMHSKWKIVASWFIGGYLLLSIQNTARSLTNAEEVTEDDIGAKASVFIRNAGRGWCSGVAYGESFVLTAAHCVIDRDGRKARAKELRVFYEKSTSGTEGSSRRVTKFVFHENYARQQIYHQKYLKRVEDILENVPLNWEDIAILKIDGTHPAGTIGAFLPSVDNDYSAAKDGPSSDFHLKGTVWFYLYGYFTGSQSVFKLQKGLGKHEKLQKVIPGSKQEPWTIGPVNFTRQLVISPLSLSSPIYVRQAGMCRGDSGGGVFLIKSNDINYDISLEGGIPNGGIELKDGHPVLIGLLVHWFVDKENSKRCSSNEETAAVRIDYYHDWILEKIKELQ